MMQRGVIRDCLTCLFILATLLVAFLLTSCERAPNINPPVFRYDIETVTRLSAEAHARDINGRAFLTMPTGSMEPTLTGGDWLVVAWVPFNELRNGEIIVYRAKWVPEGGLPVCHRIVGRDKYGLIMSGDANKQSEAQWRVTEADYVGKLIAVYRTNKNANN